MTTVADASSTTSRPTPTKRQKEQENATTGGGEVNDCINGTVRIATREQRTCEDRRHAVQPTPMRYAAIMPSATQSCSPADREILDVAVRLSVTQRPTMELMVGGCMRSMEYSASVTWLPELSPTKVVICEYKYKCNDGLESWSQGLNTKAQGSPRPN